MKVHTIFFKDGPADDSRYGFHKKWEQYKLEGTTYTPSLVDVIKEHKARIAEAAGVSVDAVKITIER